MKSIADTLVFAVAHIGCRDDENDEKYLDDDVRALEQIAFLLGATSPAEQDELAAAAERALAEEQSSLQPNARLLHDYAHWMEELFGGGWERNQRVDG